MDINILLENGVALNKSLELFGDIETYNETLKVFLTEVEEKLAKMEKYKVLADMANYAILVHSLKSDAKYFGFEQLANIAYQHELESKANHIYYIYDDFDNLKFETNKAIAIVKKYFGDNITIPIKVKNTIISDKAILIVDDSDIIRSFVSKIFSNDYAILIAHDGSEAISIINTNNKICALLLDLNMPNINGFAVLEYLKNNNLFSKIPTSIMTGVSNDSIVLEASKYPIVSILRKPFNEKNVREVLEKMLER